MGSDRLTPWLIGHRRGGIALVWLHVLVVTSAVAGQAQAPAGSPAANAKPAEKSPTATKDQKPAGSSPTTEKKPATPPRPATPKIGTGPRVLTQAEMQKPRSPFLVPPSARGAP